MVPAAALLGAALASLNVPARRDCPCLPPYGRDSEECAGARLCKAELPASCRNKISWDCWLRHDFSAACRETAFYARWFEPRRDPPPAPAAAAGGAACADDDAALRAAIPFATACAALRALTGDGCPDSGPVWQLARAAGVSAAHAAAARGACRQTCGLCGDAAAPAPPPTCAWSEPQPGGITGHNLLCLGEGFLELDRCRAACAEVEGCRSVDLSPRQCCLNDCAAGDAGCAAADAAKWPTFRYSAMRCAGAAAPPAAEPATAGCTDEPGWVSSDDRRPTCADWSDWACLALGGGAAPGLTGMPLTSARPALTATEACCVCGGGRRGGAPAGGTDACADDADRALAREGLTCAQLAATAGCDFDVSRICGRTFPAGSIVRGLCPARCGACAAGADAAAPAAPRSACTDEAGWENSAARYGFDRNYRCADFNSYYCARYGGKYPSRDGLTAADACCVCGGGARAAGAGGGGGRRDAAAVPVLSSDYNQNERDIAAAGVGGMCGWMGAPGGGGAAWRMPCTAECQGEGPSRWCFTSERHVEGSSPWGRCAPCDGQTAERGGGGASCKWYIAGAGAAAAAAVAVVAALVRRQREQARTLPLQPCESRVVVVEQTGEQKYDAEGGDDVAVMGVVVAPPAAGGGRAGGTQPTAPVSKDPPPELVPAED